MGAFGTPLPLEHFADFGGYRGTLWLVIVANSTKKTSGISKAGVSRKTPALMSVPTYPSCSEQSSDGYLGLPTVGLGNQDLRTDDGRAPVMCAWAVQRLSVARSQQYGEEEMLFPRVLLRSCDTQ